LIRSYEGVVDVVSREMNAMGVCVAREGRVARCASLALSHLSLSLSLLP